MIEVTLQCFHYKAELVSNKQKESDKSSSRTEINDALELILKKTSITLKLIFRHAFNWRENMKDQRLSNHTMMKYPIFHVFLLLPM